ncbi:hypothetical protein FACS1894101_3060 [Betaproteobacteria bacterium]|nr:hypothetical protein FACS1894101_3060 [Betaproteobacteria bacterium]
MADIADMTQERIERLALCQQRFGQAKQKPAAPEATGYCLNCGDPIADMRRWCDSECRDEWEHIDAALRRRGL